MMSTRIILKTVKGFLFMIIGCVLIFTLFNSIVSVYQRKNELVITKEYKKAIELEKASLQNEVDLLNNDDYVTRYARENYVFTREGEQVSIIPNVK